MQISNRCCIVNIAFFCLAIRIAIFFSTGDYIVQTVLGIIQRKNDKFLPLIWYFLVFFTWPYASCNPNVPLSESTIFHTPANQTAITSILLWIGFSKFRFCFHQHQIKFCLHIKAICKQYSDKYSFLVYVFLWMWVCPFRPITAAIEEKKRLTVQDVFFVLK